MYPFLQSPVRLAVLQSAAPLRFACPGGFHPFRHTHHAFEVSICCVALLFVVVPPVRYVFNEVNNRFPSLPFSLRALEDEKQVRAVAKHDHSERAEQQEPAGLVHFCPKFA